jgi:hypothetical protein
MKTFSTSTAAGPLLTATFADPLGVTVPVPSTFPVPFALVRVTFTALLSQAAAMPVMLTWLTV